MLATSWVVSSSTSSGGSPSVSTGTVAALSRFLCRRKFSDLFTAMRHILTYKDSENENHRFFFGTDRFEYVWQSMIDAAFGIPNKDQYFPKATWLLDHGTASMRKRTSLQPDSIMIYGDKCYVLDAKCYRYGWTENPDHLPGGPDINKQITYGEYIERSRSVPNERLFNAFILPYNKRRNFFKLNC